MLCIQIFVYISSSFICIDVIFIFIFNLYLALLFLFFFFILNAGKVIKKVSCFCMLKDIIVNLINAIHKIFSFLLYQLFF